MRMILRSLAVAFLATFSLICYRALSYGLGLGGGACVICDTSKGPTGAQGPIGPTGATGSTGAAPSLTYGSDESETPLDVASVSYVVVATATATLDGSLPLCGLGILTINNRAAAARDYNVVLTRNGVDMVFTTTATVRSSDFQTIPIQWHEAVSAAGSQTYMLWTKSSSATGTQEALTRSLYFREN